MIKPTKAKAKERLQGALDEIPALKQGWHDSQDFTKWHRDTEIAIANTFGGTTLHSEDFKRIRYFRSSFPTIGLADFEIQRSLQRAYVRGLDNAASILESMLDEIEDYWEDEEQEAASEIPQVDKPVDTKKVFIVHGHDQGIRAMVKEFIEQLELEPVILQEQPNRGLTVIEKFEQHAQVGFAVVLFTPDDIGSAKDDADTPRYRARQNVIFELGYLIRHLGRSRVAVLYKGDEGDIEIPSDYAGVLYTQIDGADGWKMKLIKEMKSAELDVDANRLFDA